MFVVGVATCPVVACGGGVGVDVAVVACGDFAGASPRASVACLWIRFAEWLFGGLTLLGPPAISLSEAFFVP